MRILLIGDSAIDVFKYGSVSRICPEAPCPVINITNTTENDGMAGNVYRNLLSLDKDMEIVFLTNTKKPKKIRYVESRSNQMLLREDVDDVVQERVNLDGIDWEAFSAVIVSDYNKGFLTEQDLFKISHSHPVTFLDTKKPISSFCINYKFIKINEGEWKQSCSNGAKALDWTNKLIVTMGDKGAIYNGKIYPTEQVEVPSIAGAGDSFLAAFAYYYLLYRDIETAIDYANTVCNIVVRKKGVSTI